MIHLFKYAAVKVWALTLVLIILFGVVVTAARLILPLLSDYKGQIEELIFQTTGLVTRVGSTEGLLDGLTPRLVLTDVSLTDPDQAGKRLKLERIQIDVDLFRTLISGRMSIEQGTVVGARMQLIRRLDGSVVLQGLEGLHFSEEGTSGGLLLLQLSGLRIIDSEIVWEDRLSGKAPLRLSDLHVLFSSSAKRYRLTASARLPDRAGAGIQLAADMTGDIRQPGSISGSLYIRGVGLDLALLVPAPAADAYRVRSGVLDMQLWGRLQLGELAGLKGTVVLNGIQIDQRHMTGASVLQADRLTGTLEWQRQPQGWKLEVRDLAFNSAGRAWPSSAFSIRFSSAEPGNWQLQAGVGFLRLEDLTPLLPLLPDGHDALSEILPAVEPRGEVHGLQLAMNRGDTGLTWFARGQVSDFASSPWRRLPGINGLDFDFWANQKQGTLALDSRALTVNFPRLFRGALQIDELAGNLTWKLDPDAGLVIDAPTLRAGNRDIKTLTRLQLRLPPAGSPWMDLQTDFHDVTVVAASHYYPVTIMSDKLVAWLDRSLVSGRVNSGSALLRGELRDFPFFGDEGRFEVAFDAADLILDYQDQWPRLEEAVAEIRFLNNGMSFDLHDGYLLESRVQQGRGRIEEFRGHTVLSLDAILNGPFKDDLRILTETPLAQKYGSAVEHLRVQGRARTAVQLSLSLEKDKTLQVAGSLSWDDAGLNLDNLGLSLARLRGRLDYTQYGLYCSGVQAQLFGTPITLDLDTLPAGPAQPAVTRVSARGELDAGELGPHVPAVGLQFLEGPLAVDLVIELPHGVGGLKVSADVDLAPVAVDLPAPLGKSAGVPARLKLEVQRQAPEVTELNIDYADRAAALLRFSGGSGLQNLVGGSIHIGAAPASWPTSQGLWLNGSLETLDLDAWMNWQAEHFPGESVATRKQPLVRGVELELEQLLVGGRSLKHVNLNLEHKEQAWQGRLSSDLLAGSFSLPDDYTTQPLVARLEYLNLSWADDRTQPTQETGSLSHTPETEYDPRRLPGLDLSIDQVRMNDTFIGRLGLECKRMPEGLEMQAMSVKGPNLQLTGTGTWLASEAARQRTDLNLAVSIDQLGELLRKLGYASLVQDGPTEAKANLYWQGDPSAFSAANIAGQLRIDIGPGRMLEVSPGVGRVFGLLNLGALQRRLSLDFSDLFRKGFSFDKIKGVFNLRQGDALIEDAYIEGPAARIDLEGRTGLVARDYDQTVTVTPRVISGGLPVAGALTGGPLVGAALLVAQQIMGNQVDRFSRYGYSLTGSWDDPEFTLVKTPMNWSSVGLPAEEASQSNSPRTEKPTSPVSEYLDH